MSKINNLEEKEVKVIVIDLDPVFCRMVSTYLGNCSYVRLGVAWVDWLSYESSIQKVPLDCDVAVLDARIPDIDNLVRTLREGNANIRFVLVGSIDSELGPIVKRPSRPPCDLERVVIGVSIANWNFKGCNCYTTNRDDLRVYKILHCQ